MTTFMTKAGAVLGRLDHPPGPNEHDMLTGSKHDGTAFTDFAVN